MVLLMIFAVHTSVMAQDRTPPPPPGHGGNEDIQPGPVGAGTILLLALGAAYGARKVYNGSRKSGE